MTITLNTLAYNQDSFVTPNRVQYTGPSHTYSLKDLLSLSRVAPKPTATFAGMAKSEIKRTKTITLSDSSKADVIVTLSVSAPVNAVAADVDAVVNDVCDFGLTAEGKLVYWNHDLTH